MPETSLPSRPTFTFEIRRDYVDEDDPGELTEGPYIGETDDSNWGGDIVWLVPDTVLEEEPWL